MMKNKNIVFILGVFLIIVSVVAMYFSISPDSFQLPTQSTTITATTQPAQPPPTQTTATVSSAPAAGQQSPPTQTVATTTTILIDTGEFQPSTVTLEIKSWGFNPDRITLMKGSTATWENKDGATHTVTSAGNFDSGDITAGNSWTHTFNTVGTFEYSCKYHSSMKATVVITE
jgi:plastocyanin